ncbi:hypothetical protein FRC96_11275 [Lujinxingia vulgaris]|uniref:Uncharacterized protein n=1 Tax=Lujinxingia vulgaris TaxID=2600176 RepID=A0A5C6X962_9DELT|nr:hypothetical protein [Lujinxingia vulgaris]TXD35254.1 hypothetical protein FRC96_11275 [Lujinxingia vulgaris]
MSAMISGLAAVLVVILGLVGHRVYVRERRCQVPLDDQRWILDGLDYLLRHLGGTEALRARAPFELPVEFDGGQGALSAEQAAELFSLVKTQMGIAHWPCTLLREASVFEANPALARAQAVYYADDEDVIINYRPEAEDDPRELVCIFAHELSHYILDQIEEEGPGGEARDEELTDLCAILTGFGAYTSDAALRPVVDDGTRLRDVLRNPREIRLSKLAYMSQSAMAFALAVVAGLRNDRKAAYRRLEIAPRVEFWRATHQIYAHWLDEIERLMEIDAYDVREQQVVLKRQPPGRAAPEAPKKKRRRRRRPLRSQPER